VFIAAAIAIILSRRRSAPRAGSQAVETRSKKAGRKARAS
jgi:hypothetical protein